MPTSIQLNESLERSNAALNSDGYWNYPSFSLCGYKLSLVRPYTIDDKLITGICASTEAPSYISAMDNYRTEMMRFCTDQGGLKLKFSCLNNEEISIIISSDLYDYINNNEFTELNFDIPTTNGAQDSELGRAKIYYHGRDMLKKYLQDLSMECENNRTHHSYEISRNIECLRGRHRHVQECVSSSGSMITIPYIKIINRVDIQYGRKFKIEHQESCDRSTIKLYGIDCVTNAIDKAYHLDDCNPMCRFSIFELDGVWYIEMPIDDKEVYYLSYNRLINDDNHRTINLNSSVIGREYECNFNLSMSSDNTYISNQYQTGGYINNAIHKFIHSFNYKPEYKKHFMPGENEATTLLLGAEIEVDESGEREEVAKRVLEIMNNEEPQSEENMYCVHDGSLKSGLEFPTQPCSLEYHKTLNYEEMFSYLDNEGYKAHDAEKAGLHIHINRSFFGNEKQECIGKLAYIIEKFNKEVTMLGRRGNSYSSFVGYSDEKCKDMYSKYLNRGKYSAVNLQHDNTIELRCFKSTLKYSTYMLTLEFVSDLAHFVKEHSEEEIEEMVWNDLFDTFSEELKEYYLSRVEKHKDDILESSNKDNELRGRFCDSQEIYLTSARENSRSTWAFDSFYEGYQHVLGQINSLGYTYDFSPRANLSPVEKIKKDIKDIKQKIKHCNNYIEKKSLQQKLGEFKKELKKEKKRAKREVR